MPSPFDGKWSLAHCDAAAAFYEAIKSPDEYKEKLKKLAEAVKKDPSSYVEELKVEGATFHRAVYINGEKKKDSGEAPLNTEVDAKIADGRPAKIKLVKEADNKIVRTEVGDGFNIKTVFEVAGDEMTVSMTNGSVTSVEKYKRV